MPTTTNSALQEEVEQELNWDPSITLASVGVSVHDHTVTLSGTVDSHSGHLAALRAVKRVKGVHAIADDIVVEPIGHLGRTDHDIAELAASAMKWNISVPDTVRATVRDGWVTLDGSADWDFQRRAAAYAVEHITGVRNVSNLIELKHVTSAKDIHKRIETALSRSADIDAANIHVHSEAGHVTLTGKVSSWAERERTEHTAWSAPGVTKVTDELTIR